MAKDSSLLPLPKPEQEGDKYRQNRVEMWFYYRIKPQPKRQQRPDRFCYSPPQLASWLVPLPDFLRRGGVRERSTVVEVKINCGRGIKANVVKWREASLAVGESGQVWFEAPGGRVCQDGKQRTNWDALCSKFFQVLSLASAPFLDFRPCGVIESQGWLPWRGSGPRGPSGGSGIDFRGPAVELQ